MLLSPRRALAVLSLCCLVSLLYFYSPLSSSTHSSSPFLRKLKWEHLIKPISSPPEPEHIHRILNNNVSYPSFPPHSTLSLSRAQLLAEKVEQLRFSGNGFHLADMAFDGRNKEELSRLANYLNRTQSGSALASPVVVLCSWQWIPCTWSDGCMPGEAIWARSVLEIMKHNDLFFLYTPYETLRRDFVKLGDDLVTHVWASDRHVWWCSNDSNNCLRSPSNPEGIPAYKLFAFTFWGSAPEAVHWDLYPKGPWSWNPLGQEWSLTPYQLPERHFYIGYHYPGCLARPTVPHAQRQDKIIILAKQMEYFYEFASYDAATFYLEVQQRTGMEIITNANLDSRYPVPPGVTHMGPVSPTEYDSLLANAKLVLGIGHPRVSPTPYGSLCRGVPVVIPFRSKFYSENCTGAPALDSWCGFHPDQHQHGPAGRIGKPYVYTVDVTGPIEHVYQAIEEAVSTPIESFEPEEMSTASLSRRILDYFSIDWEAYEQEKFEAGLVTRPPTLPSMMREWLEKYPDPVYEKNV